LVRIKFSGVARLYFYRDKKVVGDNVRFSCHTQQYRVHQVPVTAWLLEGFQTS
jgi:hypothetical protein